MSAQHGLFDWLRTTFGWTHETHQPTGWQRERTEQQDTDGYRLPDLLSGIAGGAPVHCAPGTWAATYRQRGNTPIPATQNTGDTPRILSARERHQRRVMSGKLTAPQLPGPDWLYANVPTGALPERYGNAPVQRREADSLRANAGRLDDMMASFLPSVQDLPTVPDYDKIVSDKLASLRPPIPLPDEFVAAFTDDTFLLASPTRLDPMDSQALASADKTDCVPQIDKDDTMARIEPGLYQLQLMARRRKESE